MYLKQIRGRGKEWLHRSRKDVAAHAALSVPYANREKVLLTDTFLAIGETD